MLDTPRVALPRPEKAVVRQVAGREGAAFAVRDDPRPRRQGLHSLNVEIAEVLLPPAVLPGVLVDADGDVVLPEQATAPGVENEPPGLEPPLRGEVGEDHGLPVRGDPEPCHLPGPAVTPALLAGDRVQCDHPVADVDQSAAGHGVDVVDGDAFGRLPHPGDLLGRGGHRRGGSGGLVGGVLHLFVHGGRCSSGRHHGCGRDSGHQSCEEPPPGPGLPGTGDQDQQKTQGRGGRSRPGDRGEQRFRIREAEPRPPEALAREAHKTQHDRAEQREAGPQSHRSRPGSRFPVLLPERGVSTDQETGDRNTQQPPEHEGPGTGLPPATEEETCRGSQQTGREHSGPAPEEEAVPHSVALFCHRFSPVCSARPAAEHRNEEGARNDQTSPTTASEVSGKTYGDISPTPAGSISRP